MIDIITLKDLGVPEKPKDEQNNEQNKEQNEEGDNNA